MPCMVQTMGVRIARKHVKWYLGHFVDSAHWIKANNKLDDMAQSLQLVEDFYIQHQARMAA